jgi:hypothetical protein
MTIFNGMIRLFGEELIQSASTLRGKCGLGRDLANARSAATKLCIPKDNTKNAKYAVGLTTQPKLKNRIISRAQIR